MTFAEKLSISREKVGYSQKELASLVGLSQSSIAAMEKGNRRVFLHHAVALARVLGVPLEYLANDAIDEVPGGLAPDEREVLEEYRECRTRGMKLRQAIAALEGKAREIEEKHPRK